MFMGASTKEGHEIAVKSREIVRSLISEQIKHLKPDEQAVVERIVHSTADPEYAELTKISENFLEESLKSIKGNGDILTDIKMVKVGITSYPGKVKCYIDHPLAYKIAREREITRAAAAMEVALKEGFHGMVVIGNSPTSLMKVIELQEQHPDRIRSVVGVPVGFVGAAESKKSLQETSIPYLITEGPKGGTPVAVAATNALINLSKE
ncbi:cobalt-precorrin-8 methylmutase [Methanobacterium sp. CWC-01]|jgi:precorrin-8X/cobalt-precorrin-8 methylmutase|uniref:cobalt-precorrin-8 methylmutase n=1 Tax=Methanobacterium aridiramus TaxID=2584467 RepID=UPI002575FDD7|nr:cobalt-precorrin-8 methylmutase [Methanobacterium sp. CWC-01]WJI09018.1 cobalt-precorrin-8 methylmutase [Methanobacterium sp. CWC-01]